MLRCLPGFLCAVLFAYAQDPYKILPKNYRIEFENEYVRVSRVRYLPGDKLPEHSHPSIPTVYVYVKDGGPIRFVHKTPRFTVTRPAVSSGGVRFNRNAQVETHEVQYMGKRSTEYLRVELKTIPGPRRRDVRLKLDADFPWEDDQVRISRVSRTADRLARPAVLVDIASGRFHWVPAGATLPQSKRAVLLELKTERAEGVAGGA